MSASKLLSMTHRHGTHKIIAKNEQEQKLWRRYFKMRGTLDGQLSLRRIATYWFDRRCLLKVRNLHVR